jgi:predicted Zn-dependent protease
MSASRIDALRSLLDRRPDDGRLRFGLAVEYLNAGQVEEGARELQTYLDSHDDEGNGWGRLAEAFVELGRTEDARAAWERGIEAAMRYGHPTMADEFRDSLADLD